MKIYPVIVFLGIILNSFNSAAQSIPTFRTRVSPTDTINPREDLSFGVGHDGIYNVTQPTVQSSSDFKLFKAVNIHDFNLITPWVAGKPANNIGAFVEYTFDLSSSTKNENAMSIHSFFIINGYRKDLKSWEQYTRVKKLKMYINNIPFAYILFMDTYKYQSVHFQDYWIKYGEKKTIRFEIIEVYPGSKYKNAAISELQFRGKAQPYVTLY